MSNIFPVENKNKKCFFVGNKYFFCSGKCSINPKSVGLPIYLIIFSYNFGHTFYYIHKFIYNNILYLIILIIFTLLFSLQIIQSLITAFIDPGSFLPNKIEDNSKSFDAKLMIATIGDQDYFLKFCYTCKIAKDLRVYHCPNCGLCILRHDHHCPWLSTCIGLNNHKHFIYLIIINIIFFVFTLYLHLYFLLYITFSEFTTVEIIFIFFLVLLNSSILLFHIVLLISHIKYICTGQTTREKIKRAPGTKNPFGLPDNLNNVKEFWNYPMKYKERIQYNDKASKYLDTNILINDYLNGNYRITQDKKIISQTLIDNGFNYSKGLIEMTNKSNESDGEKTAENINVKEESLDSKNEVLTQAQIK